MLSRDFVCAYLIGQRDAGVNPDQAKSNFISWLLDKTNSVVTENEKQIIISDLDSYSVR